MEFVNILKSDKAVFYTVGDVINFREIEVDEDLSDVPHIANTPRLYSFDVNGGIFHVYFEFGNNIIINYYGVYKITSNVYVKDKIYTYSNMDRIEDL